ncbi:tetratricopeptide repeat protein [Thalassotalea litorea]|uniref:tetratricopeptide repeat protein n=1 Tax=Thalassotalea litorea TaxID=2020715 RepID=UPI003734D446
MGSLSIRFKVIALTTIIFLLAGFTVTYKMSQNQHTLELLESPKIHDVYVLEKDIVNRYCKFREKYVIAQIASVEEAHVTVKVSNFVYMKASDAIKGIRSDKLLTHKFFSQELARLAKADLLRSWQQGLISDVGRSSDNMHLYGGIVIDKSPQPVQKKRKIRKGEEANQLAISYYQGNMGYEKNLDEAFRLFEQAAKQGHPYAQVSLAQMYRDGESVDTDVKAALYWFGEAKKQGVASAQQEYDRLCQKMAECLK